MRNLEIQMYGENMNIDDGTIGDQSFEGTPKSVNCGYTTYVRKNNVVMLIKFNADFLTNELREDGVWEIRGLDTICTDPLLEPYLGGIDIYQTNHAVLQKMINKAMG